MACPAGYGREKPLPLGTSTSNQSESIESSSIEKPKIAHLQDIDWEKQPVQPNELKKVAKEAIILFGGFTALLLQIAHPGVGRGVGNHSNFVYRAFDRADKTAIYIYTVIFGTPEEKIGIKKWVDNAHAPVQADGPNGYNAKDPELQLWVAATIYVAMIGWYEYIFGALPPARAEQVYQEFSIMGTSLQMPMGMWPKDRQAFYEYYYDMIQNHLEITDEARASLKDLWRPKHLPLWARPIALVGMPFIRRTTIEQLPAKVRQEFGLKSNKLSRAVNGFTMATFKTIYPLSPGFIRSTPMKYYMWRSRRMLKKEHLL